MLAEIWSDLKYRLRAIFRRRDLDRELDAEVEFHLEREAAKLEAQGFTRADARRRARIAFGGVQETKEASRDGRGVRLLDNLARDLRYAFRGLRATPGFTLAVIATLGLGIGANAAMFGVVDRLLLSPPPLLRDPAQVSRVYLGATERGRETFNSGFAYLRYLDFTGWSRTSEATAAWTLEHMAIGAGQDAREMQVGAMSATAFGFFDATPALGRFFTPEEDVAPNGSTVAVLSYWLWETRFGARPDVIGQTLQIGAARYAIIGVAPRDFVGFSEAERPAVFIPITAFAINSDAGPPTREYHLKYNWSWHEMIVRRKPGVSEAAASADLTAAFERSWNAEAAMSPNLTPLATAKPRVIVAPVPTERGPLQTQVAKVATWVGGVALVVLLIACANVANLLLARSLKRRREVALRLALGVSRGRLFGQLLTESTLLGILGGLAGVGIAAAGGRLLGKSFLPAGTPPLALGWRTVAFTAAAALGAGLLTGLAPIGQTRRADLAGALKTGGRDGTAQRSPIRGALLVFQGTLSVVLLIGAGLFIRSLDHATSVRLGYDVDRLAFLSLNLRGEALSTDRRAQLAEAIREAGARAPGVEGATLVLTVPFWMQWSEDLVTAGIDSVAKLGHFTLQGGSPEYFQTFGTRIVKGRGILRADRAEAPNVAVVSEAMAARLWPGRDAIGQCMRLGSDTLPCITVVGVAENIKERSLGADDLGYHYYLPATQFHPDAANVMVRFASDRSARNPAARDALRRELQKLMPGSSYLTVTPFRDMVSPRLQSWRLGATMFVGFGLLALVLASVGLYGVVAYDVAQRTTEIGVRVALGADSGAVRRLVLGEGLRFAAAGIGLGTVVALGAGRWIGPLLFAQSPRDPLIFVLVGGVLLGVAGLASAIPAGRAARVEPSVALRAD